MARSDISEPASRVRTDWLSRQGQKRYMRWSTPLVTPRTKSTGREVAGRGGRGTRQGDLALAEFHVFEDHLSRDAWHTDEREEL